MASDDEPASQKWLPSTGRTDGLLPPAGNSSHYTCDDEHTGVAGACSQPRQGESLTDRMNTARGLPAALRPEDESQAITCAQGRREVIKPLTLKSLI